MQTIVTNDPRTKLLYKLKQPEMFKDVAHEIQQKTLIIGFPLKAGKGSYEENINEGNTSAKKLSIERRISQDAIFFPYGYRVMLGKIRSNNDTDFSGNSLFYSYPDPAHFNNVNVGGIPEFLALFTVYNGEFSIKANNENVYHRMPCIEALNVPETQTRSGAIPSIEARANYTAIWNHKGLAGSRSNKIELKLADGDTTAIEGKYTLLDPWVNYCFIELPGFEVLNASEHKTYKAMTGGEYCKCV